jgi:hypothetical protein
VNKEQLLFIVYWLYKVLMLLGLKHYFYLCVCRFLFNFLKRVLKSVIDTSMSLNFFYIMTLKETALIKTYSVIIIIKLGPHEEIKLLSIYNH